MDTVCSEIEFDIKACENNAKHSFLEQSSARRRVLFDSFEKHFREIANLGSSNKSIELCCNLISRNIVLCKKEKLTAVQFVSPNKVEFSNNEMLLSRNSCEKISLSIEKIFREIDLQQQQVISKLI